MRPVLMTARINNNVLVHVLHDMQWDPPTLEQVSEDMVEHHLSPLSKVEPDLELPTTLREAFT